MHTNQKSLEQLEKDFDFENYRPLSVVWHLRHAILSKLRAGEDVLPDIDGREETKADFIRAVLSGCHPYLVSEEGTGKTRLARSLARLLPPVPVIKGCPYHDDPKMEQFLLCSRCQEAKKPVEKYGIEFIPGEARFSRIQGNEYTNEAKLLGLKDIQAIANGASPSDPEAFIGTGVFRANRGILMIDELPAIRTKVQVLLHPLLEEKKAVLEEYNWERFVDLILISTGNPGGFSHVNDIPRPLLDRVELIFMELPESEIEKEIMLKERSPLQPDGYFSNNNGFEPNWDPNIDYDLVERKAVVPWWVVEVLNRTVRYSRECSSLEKASNIRGGTKAFEHTLSSVEMAGRNVANLEDAFFGLRLALRGRIALRSDFIDFDSPEKTARRVDQVVGDMLRDVLNQMSRSIFQGLELRRDRFISEIISICEAEAKSNAPIDLSRYSEVGKIIDRMKASWETKLPQEYCTPYEVDLFTQETRVTDSLQKEYLKSAVGFVSSVAAIRGFFPADTRPSNVFIPKKFSF